MQSALYRGLVSHVRLRPKQHRLQYRVFSMLIDLDELSKLDRFGLLMGVDRAAVLSFRQRDHGDGRRGGLKDWALARLREAGLPHENVSIRLLCYPRMFGYVFNPLSIYYCFDTDGTLFATLYEVNNTFGERHTYVLPSDKPATGLISQSASKQMPVSPFTGMNAHYRFRLGRPEASAHVAIGLYDPDGLLLSAAFKGKRQEISRKTLLSALFSYPLMTLKVIVGIHVEALKLWLKGVPLVPRRTEAEPKGLISSEPRPKLEINRLQH